MASDNNEKMWSENKLREIITDEIDNYDLDDYVDERIDVKLNDYDFSDKIDDRIAEIVRDEIKNFGEFGIEQIIKEEVDRQMRAFLEAMVAAGQQGQKEETA